MLLENVLDRVNSLEERLKQLTPTNKSSASSYGVIRPVESLVHSTTESGNNGNSVNVQGMFYVVLKIFFNCHWLLLSVHVILETNHSASHS